MTRNLAGLKIRTQRKRAGLTQGELARRAGISASYLNLIELNKRTIAGALIDRIAAGLGVDRAEFDDTPERRAIDSLDELSVDPAFAGSADHPRAAAEFVSRHPDWAHLLLKVYRAFIDRNEAVMALADRLNRDPFLGENVHRILTGVTAIRAASEILGNYEGLGAADRGRFLNIIATDSEKLSDAARSLAQFFYNPDMRAASGSSMEQVDAFMFESGNYFPELEEVAAGVVRKHAETLHDGAGPVWQNGDSPAGTDVVTGNAQSRRFRRVRELSAPMARGAVSALIADRPVLASDEARLFAASALHSYTAAAILMPYEPFLAAAERSRYDLDSLSRLFDVSYEQAAHRLATLRRPGAEGVRFAFMRSDPSGYVTKRLPLPRLPLPRYSNACPLWVIYAAFQRPGATVRSFGALPAGDSFLCFARAIEKSPPSVTFPRHLLSIMLACPASEAGRVVYGDGIDRSDPRTMVPVGTTCRLCPRERCNHRQEAALFPDALSS
jgi:predicted transcriptional regulator/transcriptional regulator with XRE-family HTH domain